MTILEDQYGFRDTLVEHLERDLVGPGDGPDEELSDPPITRYVSGILFPVTDGTIDADRDVDDAPITRRADGDGDQDDPSVTLANTRYPSSMGLTFAVDRSTPEIVVEIEAARYVPVHVEPTEEVEDDSLDKGRRSSSRARTTTHWQRRPESLAPIRLRVDIPEAGRRETIADGLILFYRIRPADSFGHVAVTLILMNGFTTTKLSERDADSWFQPVIRVRTESGPGIVHRPGPEPPEWDEDLRVYRLIYRHATSMGVGHGCAITWKTGDDPTRTDLITTTFVPRYELLLSDSNPDISTSAMGMRKLAHGEQSEVLAGLRAMCTDYAAWIDARATEVPTLTEAEQPVANLNLENCRTAIERMRHGIDRLETDPTAWLAFQLMNEAMLRQRAQSAVRSRGDAGAAPALDDTHVWRPFQIAFILLCLDGIIDPSGPDRDLADLLWFPTGGGKTEAYLGLLAFTILLRRLRNPTKGHGVTVLMRYTLRLLTIQQFERASLLICCLEAIRRQRIDLGTEPISIGLWVGQAATPNNLRKARVAIDQLRKGVELAESNPLQLQHCPWCGTGLDSYDLYIRDTNPRLVIRCRNEECEFHSGDGLPIHVVDEDIYRHHPSLIIATVDKFASLPWKEQCHSLFNLDVEGIAPPELIIQDELHLISGPLGTLTGLYEAAIDMLCSNGAIRPKIVASTATIRRAHQQTLGLFDRAVRQFPPPGLDGRDSYFAVEAPRDERGSRMYVGCIAPSTSQTSLMVRAYSALLQATEDEPAPDPVKDPYWTLVGYFNSLRVLGGARMQVQDDVGDRLELLSGRAGTETRRIENRIELTSRAASTEIPDHLNRLGDSLPAESVIDVVFATNMISVGVDIDRLGLMVVMGQPQSSSEYIQATSRVGRRHPGLVVVLFNAAKSRDRSHYESFTSFHAAMYRQVESASVTPFSPRARDRALHAVLIALARASIPDLRPNAGAGMIREFESDVRHLGRRIVERVEAVDPREARAVQAELTEVIDDWIERAAEESDLVYQNSQQPDVSLLGDASMDEDELQGALATLWSLRDVDQTSNLYQVS